MSPIEAADSSRRTQSTGNTYNAVFTDKKDNATVKASDFLNLMVAQMKSQDFMNPMDDTQFVTQMAQFSTMQQMQEMAEYSKSNYAMSLVGKTVTATRFTVSGSLDTTTGLVEKISLVDNEYILSIQGKKYTLSQVMEIQAGQNSGKEEDPVCAVDPSKLSVEAGETTKDAAVVTWKVATEDVVLAKELKYTVYYSKEGPFDTLESVKKGSVSGEADRRDIAVDTITGLEPATEYYINVVVKDKDGVEAVYKPVKVKTQADIINAAAMMAGAGTVPESTAETAETEEAAGAMESGQSQEG